MTDLEGKRVVLTGGSSGIGAALAGRLVALGAEVHSLSRRASPHEGVTSHVVDVTDPLALGDVVRRVADDGLDVLACCAGINVPGRRLDEVTQRDWQDIHAVNLTSVLVCLQTALPYLRESRGHVLVVNSVSAAWPDASGPAYQSSKHGLLGLVRAAALEELGRGVRFTTVLPGLTATPLLARRPEQPSAETLAAVMQPDDVAQACLLALQLPSRACVAELTIVPTQLQAPGRT
jgi:NAD(P)-dependent dehydrogenase (short-subunit alcohol dehydrogenase family)